MGLVVIGAALARYLHQRRDIERSELRQRTILDLLLIGSAAAAGVVVIYLVAR